MIIHSIPFLNEDFVRKEKKQSILDWHEFRLDYHPEPTSFPVDLIDEKTILTIRDTKFGGKNSFPLQEKVFFYEKICQKTDCLIDLEIENYQKTTIPPVNLIISHHNFISFDTKELEKIIEKANSISAKYLKIAVPINLYSQLNEIPLLISQSNKPVIFVGMGKLGKIARMLANHLDSAGFYAGSDGSTTAIGQITINEVTKFNLQSVDKHTYFGGLIGGEQVFDSLGMSFYNYFFYENKMKAVYLPFPVEESSDFRDWISNCPFQEKCYGFSVTMPFKKNFLHPQNLLPAINLIHFQNNFTENTDMLAFQKSFSFLDIQKKQSILLIGSGGSAEAFIFQFHKTHEISILSRNNVQENKLIKKYNIVPIQEKEYDVLINCTPLKSDELLEYLAKYRPKKVIDLPYFEKDTSLITFCKNQKIPYVDGRQFWKWQAERQLQYFLESIDSKIV